MKIGIIGLGLVGTALAQRFLAAGHSVVGCDLDPVRATVLQNAGGTPLESAVAVARAADVIVLALMDSDVVQNVVEGPQGICEAETLPRLIVDTSTGDPDRTAALAQRLQQRGIDYVDAPLSGSSEQIADGKGVFMAGGTPEAVTHARSILAAVSGKFFHLGPAGSGARAKLATNLVLGLNRLVLAEGVVFAEQLGLDLPAFIELLRATPAYSAAVDSKGTRMITGDFTPAARLKQHLKDVALILKQAQRTQQQLPLSSLHADILRAAVEAGDGDLDNAAVIRELRRRRLS